MRYRRYAQRDKGPTRREFPGVRSPVRQPDAGRGCSQRHPSCQQGSRPGVDRLMGPRSGGPAFRKNNCKHTLQRRRKRIARRLGSLEAPCLRRAALDRHGSRGPKPASWLPEQPPSGLGGRLMGLHHGCRDVRAAESRDATHVRASVLPCRLVLNWLAKALRRPLCKACRRQRPQSRFLSPRPIYERLPRTTRVKKITGGCYAVSISAPSRSVVGQKRMPTSRILVPRPPFPLRLRGCCI